MKRTQLDIFEFTDFRDLLRARFEELKAEDGKYSYAFIARRAGTDNSGWLKMAISGKRKLGEQQARKLAHALGFDRDQSAFFLNLVDFNQARDEAARAEALQRLRRKRGFKCIHRVELNQLDYLTNPLAMLLREMVALRDFKEDPDWIVAKLPAPVSKAKIRKTLKELLHIGLLERDADGGLVQKHAIQFTGHGLKNHALLTCYDNQFKQASEALRLPAAVRNYGFITMTLSPKSFATINEKLETLRQEIFEILEEDDNCDQVYQYVMGLFPLTGVDESWSDNDASEKKRKNK